MGAIWLDGRDARWPSVVDVLRAGGVRVAEYDGWRTRSRSSGGFTTLAGVVHHHTASQTTPANDLHFMVVGCPDAPVSNGLLDRTGLFTVIAAGAANHAGKGGPRGTIPLDAGNSNAFGIEAANNGTGEPWPKAQTDAYVAMTRALSAGYGLPITPAVMFSHYEWTPGRKIDPAGPSPWPTINPSQTWDMDAYRATATAGAPDEGDEPMIQMLTPTNGAQPIGRTFARWPSGALTWATNADTVLANRLKVPTDLVEMGGDQYAYLCDQAGVDA